MEVFTPEDPTPNEVGVGPTVSQLEQMKAWDDSFTQLEKVLQAACETTDANNCSKQLEETPNKDCNCDDQITTNVKVETKRKWEDELLDAVECNKGKLKRTNNVILSTDEVKNQLAGSMIETDEKNPTCNLDENNVQDQKSVLESEDISTPLQAEQTDEFFSEFTKVNPSEITDVKKSDFENIAVENRENVLPVVKKDDELAEEKSYIPIDSKFSIDLESIEDTEKIDDVPCSSTVLKNIEKSSEENHSKIDTDSMQCEEAEENCNASEASGNMSTIPDCPATEEDGEKTPCSENLDQPVDPEDSVDKKKEKKEKKEETDKNAKKDDKKKKKFERCNIRDIKLEDELDAVTLSAQKEEQERIRRLQEAQMRALQERLQQIEVEKEALTQLFSQPPPDAPNLFDTTSITTEIPRDEEVKSEPVVKSETDVVLLESSDDDKQAKLQNLIPAPIEENIIDISSSSSGSESDSDSSDKKDDDIMVLSDEGEPETEGGPEDPNNSGAHTNDCFNQPDEEGRVLVNVGHPPEDPDIFLAPQIAKVIKPHQIGGIRFLYDNVVENLERYKSSSGFGCILAHSMGLGKTVQVVSFVDVFLRHTPATLVLCIVPINTIQNWKAEFDMWVPPSACIDDSQVISGEVRPRDYSVYTLNENFKTMAARAALIADWRKQGGVLLMGYEMYRMLALRKMPKIPVKKSKRLKKQDIGVEPETNEQIKKYMDEMYEHIVIPGPDLVICDEGHRIKNSLASTSMALKSIKTRRRVVLTGYPLQNNLLEYWCMVDFVRPNYLGSRAEFCNMFERPISNGQCIDSTPRDRQLMRFRSHVLHSLLVGFVQRRGHSVLRAVLPKKEEHVLLIRMTPIQRQLYKCFVKDLLYVQQATNPLKLFAVCCKIWNHPDILYKLLQEKKAQEDIDLDIDITSMASNSSIAGVNCLLKKRGIMGSKSKIQRRAIKALPQNVKAQQHLSADVQLSLSPNQALINVKSELSSDQDLSNSQQIDDMNFSQSSYESKEEYSALQVSEPKEFSQQQGSQTFQSQYLSKKNLASQYCQQNYQQSYRSASQYGQQPPFSSQSTILPHQYAQPSSNKFSQQEANQTFSSTESHSSQHFPLQLSNQHDQTICSQSSESQSIYQSSSQQFSLQTPNQQYPEQNGSKQQYKNQTQKQFPNQSGKKQDGSFQPQSPSASQKTVNQNFSSQASSQQYSQSSGSQQQFPSQSMTQQNFQPQSYQSPAKQQQPSQKFSQTPGNVSSSQLNAQQQSYPSINVSNKQQVSGTPIHQQFSGKSQFQRSPPQSQFPQSHSSQFPQPSPPLPSQQQQFHQQTSPKQLSQQQCFSQLSPSAQFPQQPSPQQSPTQSQFSQPSPTSQKYPQQFSQPSPEYSAQHSSKQQYQQNVQYPQPQQSIQPQYSQSRQTYTEHGVSQQYSEHGVLQQYPEQSSTHQQHSQPFQQSYNQSGQYPQQNSPQPFSQHNLSSQNFSQSAQSQYQTLQPSHKFQGKTAQETSYTQQQISSGNIQFSQPSFQTGTSKQINVSSGEVPNKQPKLNQQKQLSSQNSPESQYSSLGQSPQYCHSTSQSSQQYAQTSQSSVQCSPAQSPAHFSQQLSKASQYNQKANTSQSYTQQSTTQFNQQSASTSKPYAQPANQITQYSQNQPHTSQFPQQSTQTQQYALQSQNTQQFNQTQNQHYSQQPTQSAQFQQQNLQSSQNNSQQSSSPFPQQAQSSQQYSQQGGHYPQQPAQSYSQQTSPSSQQYAQQSSQPYSQSQASQFSQQLISSQQYLQQPSLSPKQYSRSTTSPLQFLQTTTTQQFPQQASPQQFMQQPVPSPQQFSQQLNPSAQQLSPQQFSQQRAPSPQPLLQQPTPSPQQFPQQPTPSPQQFPPQPTQSPHQFLQQPTPTPQQFPQQPTPSPQPFPQQPAPSPHQFSQQPAASPQQFPQQPAPSPQQFPQQPTPATQQFTQQPTPSPQQFPQQPAPSTQQFPQQPTPSTQQFGQQPAASPQQFPQQPVPSPQQFPQQPSPSPQQFPQQPAPSPQQFPQQPAPSPQQFPQQPSPSPQQFPQQPTPSPQQFPQQPTPSPQQFPQQPTPSPQQFPQQPTPSPQQFPQQPTPSPQQFPQQPTPSPQQFPQQPTPSPQQFPQQPSPSPHQFSQQPSPSSHQFSQQTTSSQQFCQQAPSQQFPQQPSPSQFSQQPTSSPQQLSQQPALSPQQFSQQPAPSPQQLSQPMPSHQQFSQQSTSSPQQFSQQPPPSPQQYTQSTQSSQQYSQQTVSSQQFSQQQVPPQQFSQQQSSSTQQFPQQPASSPQPFSHQPTSQSFSQQLTSSTQQFSQQPMTSPQQFPQQSIQNSSSQQHSQQSSTLNQFNQQALRNVQPNQYLVQQQSQSQQYQNSFAQPLNQPNAKTGFQQEFQGQKTTSSLPDIQLQPAMTQQASNKPISHGINAKQNCPKTSSLTIQSQTPNLVPSGKQLQSYAQQAFQNDSPTQILPQRQPFQQPQNFPSNNSSVANQDNFNLQHMKQENVSLQHMKQENISLQNVKQENITLQHIKQENSSLQHMKQENSSLQHMKKENMSLQHIKQENMSLQHIKQENTGNFLSKCPKVLLQPVKTQQIHDASTQSQMKNETSTVENEQSISASLETSIVPIRDRMDSSINYEWAIPIMKDYVLGVLENSHKMMVLFVIISETLHMGDKLLVFSQSLSTLDLLEHFLGKIQVPQRSDESEISNHETWCRNKNYFRLDGSTSAQEREKLINEFNRNDNVSLFLLSTRAGCLGINLVGANRIVVMDASWNPCHDAQAVCRIYRYGQKKQCHIYRLVTDNSLEKRIYDRQVNKQGMSDRVVDELNPESNFTWKDVTTLIQDDEDDGPVQELAEFSTSYSDKVLKYLVSEMSPSLSKEPFEHESLLLDRKDLKLTKQEKKLAKQSYEMAKRANMINIRTTYTYLPTGNAGGGQFIINNKPCQWVGGTTIRVLPNQSTSGASNVRSGTTATPITASPSLMSSLFKQGVMVQKLTMPSNVSIPVLTPGAPPVVIPAGQDVLVLRTPKGVYLRLPDGRIIAVQLPPSLLAKTQFRPNVVTHFRPAAPKGSNQSTVINTPRGQSIGIIKQTLQCGGTVRYSGPRTANAGSGQNANRSSAPEVIDLSDDDEPSVRKCSVSNMSTNSSGSESGSNDQDIKPDLASLLPNKQITIRKLSPSAQLSTIQLPNSKEKCELPQMLTKNKQITIMPINPSSQQNRQKMAPQLAQPLRVQQMLLQPQQGKRKPPQKNASRVHMTPLFTGKNIRPQITITPHASIQPHNSSQKVTQSVTLLPQKLNTAENNSSQQVMTSTKSCLSNSSEKELLEKTQQTLSTLNQSELSVTPIPNDIQTILPQVSKTIPSCVTSLPSSISQSTQALHQLSIINTLSKNSSINSDVSQTMSTTSNAQAAQLKGVQTLPSLHGQQLSAKTKSSKVDTMSHATSQFTLTSTTPNMQVSQIHQQYITKLSPSLSISALSSPIPPILPSSTQSGTLQPLQHVSNIKLTPHSSNVQPSLQEANLQPVPHVENIQPVPHAENVQPVPNSANSQPAPNAVNIQPVPHTTINQPSLHAGNIQTAANAQTAPHAANIPHLSQTSIKNLQQKTHDPLHHQMNYSSQMQISHRSPNRTSSITHQPHVMPPNPQIALSRKRKSANRQPSKKSQHSLLTTNQAMPSPVPEVSQPFLHSEVSDHHLPESHFPTFSHHMPKPDFSSFTNFVTHKPHIQHPQPLHPLQHTQEHSLPPHLQHMSHLYPIPSHIPCSSSEMQPQAPMAWPVSQSSVSSFHPFSQSSPYYSSGQESSTFPFKPSSFPPLPQSSITPNSDSNVNAGTGADQTSQNCSSEL